jgi:hypothetical protein
MKKFWKWLKMIFNHWLFVLFVLVILGAFATVLIKLITDSDEPWRIPIFVVVGWGVFVILFTWVRQLYWKITGTGDYSKKTGKKK